jgi:hypothetical protein
MKIKENGWTFYFKTRQFVLIYVFNVLLVNNIWTKKITKINDIIPLSHN